MLALSLEVPAKNIRCEEERKKKIRRGVTNL